MAERRETERLIRPVEQIAAELKIYSQWVNWRMDGGRKVPVNPVTLRNAGVRWPNTWTSFRSALETAAHYNLGLGFVLTEDDPFTCVDLDHCVDDEGQVAPAARAILDLLAGWVELSPSGTGLHIWVKNQQPVNRRTQGIEIYSSARWITMTGNSRSQVLEEIPDRTAELESLVKLRFPEPKREFVSLPVVLGDEEVWQRLFTSKNGPFFQSLFAGDISVCHNDHSRAVILLANQLALLTGLDEIRIKRLLYQTGLVNPKWETRRGQITWIDYQIQDAIRYVAGRKR